MTLAAAQSDATVTPAPASSLSMLRFVEGSSFPSWVPQHHQEWSTLVPTGFATVFETQALMHSAVQQSPPQQPQQTRRQSDPTNHLESPAAMEELDTVLDKIPDDDKPLVDDSIKHQQLSPSSEKPVTPSQYPSADRATLSESNIALPKQVTASLEPDLRLPNALSGDVGPFHRTTVSTAAQTPPRQSVSSAVQSFTAMKPTHLYQPICEHLQPTTTLSIQPTTPTSASSAVVSLPTSAAATPPLTNVPPDASQPLFGPYPSTGISPPFANLTMGSTSFPLLAQAPETPVRVSRATQPNFPSTSHHFALPQISNGHTVPPQHIWLPVSTIPHPTLLHQMSFPALTSAAVSPPTSQPAVVYQIPQHRWQSSPPQHSTADSAEAPAHNWHPSVFSHPSTPQSAQPAPVWHHSVQSDHSSQYSPTDMPPGTPLSAASTGTMSPPPDFASSTSGSSTISRATRSSAGRLLSHTKSKTPVEGRIKAVPDPENPNFAIIVEERDASGRIKKLYKCSYPGCGKMCNRLYNLKSHVLVHTNNRPFHCELCNMSFARKHDLQRHKRSTHERSRQHICERCGLSFTRGDAYRRHMAIEEKKRIEMPAGSHDCPSFVVAGSAVSSQNDDYSRAQTTLASAANHLSEAGLMPVSLPTGASEMQAHLRLHNDVNPFIGTGVGANAAFIERFLQAAQSQAAHGRTESCMRVSPITHPSAGPSPSEDGRPHMETLIAATSSGSALTSRATPSSTEQQQSTAKETDMSSISAMHLSQPL